MEKKNIYNNNRNNFKSNIQNNKNFNYNMEKGFLGKKVNINNFNDNSYISKNKNEDNRNNNSYNKYDNFNRNNYKDNHQNKYYSNKNNNFKNHRDNYFKNDKRDYNNNYHNKNYSNYDNNRNNMNKNDYHDNQKNIDNKLNKNNEIKIVENEENKKLPIFPQKEEILEKIKNNRVTIISGNTGCGKSTQVPQYIYENFKNSKIIITQPRRIAAISIANRLSFERNTKLGKLIGYHVSMITNYSSETQIFVKTTGVFLEELLHNNDNGLFDYTHIIIDEVHERDLYVDLVLVLLKNYFQKNPNSNKKLILMSATIAESEFAKYLDDINIKNDVPIIRIKEKWHEVKTFYIDDIIRTVLKSDKVDNKLKEKINEEKSSCISLSYSLPMYSESLFPVVTAIIQKIEKDNLNIKNGILIFIPGYAEILDLQEYLMNFFSDNYDLEFLILHSQVTDEEQERAFKIDKRKRKIILATNIAESSITISNIDFVIDFCLVKQTKFDENQNTSVLELKWCSKASCQQRKGRTGRVKNGYYFQLVTRDLYKEFQEHQEPEILRTPLETPILKLKIYDEQQEPEIILSKTMNPPSQETIINTIFRLEKMGAITNIDFNQDELDNDINYDIKALKNGTIKIKKIENNNKINYNSGKITKIGEIYALLPIDIKYSRLIVLSYALGQIDVGITLASILSQERPLFLNSNKCNRLSLYDSKNYFCDNQNCDFIASYTAYKYWCSKYRKDFINENIDFDTRLRGVGKKYNEIRKFTREQNLDLKVLKEIIRVENDLKKRLITIGMYSKLFEPKGEDLKPVNFKDKKTVFILKIILAGTFYNQIFAPEYDNFQAVDNDINRFDNSSNEKKQDELYTIRIYNIEKDENQKLIEIFEAIIPGKIILKDYDESTEQLTIKFSDIESIRKILFITSAALRRNSEIPILKYIKKEEKESNESINRNIIYDNTVLIKLGKEPDYLYNVHYYDIYIGGEIFLDKDSINLTYIVENYEILKKTKFVTDSYINKNGNTIKKYARFTSLLPKVQMFDKYMMLIFGPKFEMIASRINNNNNNNNDVYSHYIGFQTYEFLGPNYFDYDSEFKNSKKKYVKSNFVKLDYLFTNFHLKEINEVRQMINEMINFRFISNNKNGELCKEEFDELKSKYLKKSNDILLKIKNLLDGIKLKYINDKRYDELFNYIQQYNRKNKIMNNINDNNEIKEENKEKEEHKKDAPYMAYINEIKELKKKVEEKDFLQLHEPLIILGEFFFNTSEQQKMINREKKISEIYNDYQKILDRMKSLIYSKEAWLCCPKCFKDICSIKPDLPRETNRSIGEHIIEGAFINSTLKSIQENKDKINKEDIENFQKNLKENHIKYEDLFCCPSGDNIIGYFKKTYNKNNNNYNRNNEIKYERYIYYKSNLYVKYPDLNIDKVDKEEYKDGFRKINQKVKQIMIYKESEEFKRQICCKLCGFMVEKKTTEFKNHLNSKMHREKMEELKKEFLF